MNKIVVLSISLLGSVFGAEQEIIPEQGVTPTSKFFLTQNLMEQLLPNYTHNNLIDFYKKIFSDLSASRRERTEAIQFSQGRIDKLIFNQEGYDEGIELLSPQLNELIGKQILIGKSLKLEDGTPIGYNIILPKGEVKASIVHIYGGLSAEARLTSISKPMDLSPFDLALMSEGVAIIKLNLSDLLTSGNSQHETSEELFHKLHKSINRFYGVIHSMPEQLDPHLEKLKGKPIFLYGASFGGQRTIRHAELYPGTFNGYISHSGGLSLLLEKNTSPQAIRAKEWLYPMTDDPNSDAKISAIQDPILLLHSYDDNNVPIQIALDWYRKAKKVGKGPLIQALFTDRGNVDVGIVTPTKGHGTPSDQKAFDKYLKKISSFISSNKLPEPQLNHQVRHAERQVEKMKMLSAKNASDVELQGAFLSEAYRLFKAAPKAGEGRLTARSISDSHQQEAAWMEFYEPLYYSLAYLEKIKGDQTLKDEELNRLHSQGLLTPERLSRALMMQLYPFTDYLKEYRKVSFPKADIPDVSNAPELQKRFVEILLTPTLVPTQEEIELESYPGGDIEKFMKKMALGDKIKNYKLQMKLLELFYVSNLDLIKLKIEELKQDPTMRQGEDTMKAKFLSRIQKIHRS